MANANMQQSIIQIIIGAISAAVLDAIFLGVILRSFYLQKLNFILKPAFGASEILSVIGIYLLIGVGITYFVIHVAKKKSDAALKGALFGLVIYGIYDLTNYAFIVTWSPALMVVDILWGVVASAAVATIVYAWSARNQAKESIRKPKPQKSK